MRSSLRHFHRRLAPFLFVLLAVTAVTGVAYRVGRTWFGMDRQTGQAVMAWHTGEWLGPFLSPLYVLVTGLGLLFLLVTGLFLLRQKGGRHGARLLHRVLGGLLLLPLIATATTGILYKLGHSWFGISGETADLLMAIHEGAWLGKSLKVYYSIILGGGLLGLGLTGLLLLKRKRSANS